MLHRARAEILRDTNNDAADQCAPQAAEASKHHDLKRDQQTARPDFGIEIGPYRHAASGRHDSQSDHAHCDP